MKKRYELQFRELPHGGKRWTKSGMDEERDLLREKKDAVDLFVMSNGKSPYRVVQKLGRKVIKVVYPKGVKK